MSRDEERPGDALLATVTHARLRAAQGDPEGAQRLLRGLLRERPGDPEAERLLRAWRAALGEEDGDRRLALRRVARDEGLKRAELYRLLVELGENPDRG